MCLLSYLLVRISNLPRGDIQKRQTAPRWSPVVRGELYMATIMLPLVESCVRDPDSARLSATDATLTSFMRKARKGANF